MQLGNVQLTAQTPWNGGWKTEQKMEHCYLDIYIAPCVKLLKVPQGLMYLWHVICCSIEQQGNSLITSHNIMTTAESQKWHNFYCSKRQMSQSVSELWMMIRRSIQSTDQSPALLSGFPPAARWRCRRHSGRWLNDNLTLLELLLCHFIRCLQLLLRLQVEHYVTQLLLQLRHFLSEFKTWI